MSDRAMLPKTAATTCRPCAPHTKHKHGNRDSDQRSVREPRILGSSEPRGARQAAQSMSTMPEATLDRNRCQLCTCPWELRFWAGRGFVRCPYVPCMPMHCALRCGAALGLASSGAQPLRWPTCHCRSMCLIFISDAECSSNSAWLQLLS
jgi:hypothetical protein